MPRSLWNGTITFGVIAVPVKLYTAVESKTVRFREVHLEDEAKIEHRRFCSKEDKEVPYDEVVKGYETSRGPSTSCSRRRRSRRPPATAAHVIDIESFVEATAIDPVFYEKTYYLGAGAKGGDAYRLLHDALERTGRAGLGRFTFHNREYLAAIRPLDGVLGLHTMRFADEVVAGKDIELSTPSRKARRRRRSRWRAGSSARCTRSRSTRASARTATARRCST